MVVKRRYESPRQLARQSNILRCAREMLSETGYAGMTMRALADKAKVAPATLYNLYSSKDQIVVAAVTDLFEELAEEVAATGVAEGVEFLVESAKASGEQIRRTPAYAEAMSIVVFNLQPDHPLVDALLARAYHIAAEQLAIARRKGQLLPHVDVDNLARHLMGQSWGMVLLWRMGFICVEDVVDERARNYLMTLIGVTRGAVRQRLEAQLQELNVRTLEREGAVHSQWA